MSAQAKGFVIGVAVGVIVTRMYAKNSAPVVTTARTAP